MKQILMLLLKVNKSTTTSKKSLVEFSFPATMIKIKENKEKGDLTRKERDWRRRNFQVVHVQTQEQVKLQTRKVKPLNLITQRIKDEIKNSYLHWRKNKCEELEEQNLNELMKTTSGNKIWNLRE